MGKNVLVRLPNEITEKLRKEAERKGLSLSSYIRMLLYERLEAEYEKRPTLL